MEVNMNTRPYSRIQAIGLMLALTIFTAPSWAQSTAQDDQLLNTVSHRLERKGLLDQGQIQVAVRDGEILLTGSVDTLRQAQRAAHIASQTRGVRAVRSSIDILSLGRPDREIRKDLQRILDVELNTTPFDWVEIALENGQVLLTGQVENPVVQSRIARAVTEVPGVWHLINSVQILPVSAFDDQLRREALLALYRNPAFSHSLLSGMPTIHILVENGRITLKGTVSSRVQAKLAESLVRTSTTHYGVENQILVTTRRHT
jgi:hyperosmotically inducible protein